MRPISGGPTPNPYGSRFPVARQTGVAVRRAEEVRPEEVRAAGDVEVSVRLFADGRSITVRRRTVAEPDGTRRVVGIDALVR